MQIFYRNFSDALNFLAVLGYVEDNCVQLESSYMVCWTLSVQQSIML